MEQELDRLVQAIAVASDPTQVALHQEALQYLSTIQQNVNETWRIALSLFTDATPEGARKYPTQARFFALRILDDFLDNRFEPFDDESFQTIQRSLVSYIQSEYVYGSAEASAPFLRNKFSHTLTLFFLGTYINQWPTFFNDIFSLIRPAESSSSSRTTFNGHVSLLFFHLVLEISGEVADQMMKAARTFNQVRQARDARVRDAMRERDAARINDAVLTIVAEEAERMSNLRKREPSADTVRELDAVVEVVDWGIRTFASYVGWIDINLTVTPATVPLFINLLTDTSLPIRLATSVALLRLISKGLKEPSDKLQLIKVLSLGPVIDALEGKTRAQQLERGSDTDEGEESYREALGKLLNVLGLELTDLTKLDETPANNEIRSEANTALNEILPVMLRFMADEYDDTCSTIFPMLQATLSSYKRFQRASSEPIDPSKREFLVSLLKVILEKMKWDEDSDPEDIDEDDRDAFEGLRKELRNFMDAISVLDQDLVTESVQILAVNTLSAYSNRVPIKWHDAELAIYLVYIFGELNKTGGKGRAAFCQAPPVDKLKRKATDYSEYPLTSHGNMIMMLVESGISAYPHRAVVMQYFETVARYSDFFKVRKQYIMPVLEAMIDTRGLHNSDSTVRSRVFYLFYRFIKEGRNDIPPELAVNLINGVRDLLPVQVDIPELEDPLEQDLLTEAAANPGAFEPQLYLFETVGTLCSLLFRTPEQQSALLLTVVQPLLDDLSINLQAFRAKGAQDVLPILKVHHIIMALGNVAKGYPDYPSPVPEGYILPPLEVFGSVAQAVLVCLEAMNVFQVVRDATRFAFARILAPTGPNITHFIPTLMTHLLAHFEPSELVDFMNFIGLLAHKLQKDMFQVADELIGPLSAHITALLSQPISGTDDQVTRTDTKKAYLALLNNIMSSKLYGIFTSERNKGGFEPLLENMQRLAEDVSDPTSQKAAFAFLGRCVSIWGQPIPSSNGNTQSESTEGIPGFERFLYERIVPTAFRVPSLPEFNLKDGQMMVALHEIANLLQTIYKTRGTEASDYFLSVFLPSQNWPPEAALDFTTKLKELDAKNFRKYFTDFVRSSRAGS